jgi:dTDP-4-dehydrorhamnose 3,5-epimerase
VKRIETSLPGVFVVEPQVFGDQRGWFAEFWNERTFADLGLDARFVQDNQSLSPRGVLRGLHYQIRHTQDKLVRCVAGTVFDVVVDVRRDSPTFGRNMSVELSADNKRMLWVPKGFAHGFLVLSEYAEVLYKVTDFWDRESERGVRWNDGSLGLAWPDLGMAPRLHPRDAGFPLLRDIPAGDLLPGAESP